MPADKSFEEHMQQQLDALRIQPPASDWQQIHAALHPAKRRRIIWWWLPMAALLISGAIYLAKEPSGVAREGRETMMRAIGNEGKAIGSDVPGNEENAKGNDDETMGNDGKAITEQAIDNNEKGASNEILGNDRKAITKKAIGNNQERIGGNQNSNGLILERPLSTGQAIKEKQLSGIDVESNTATAEGKKSNVKSAFTTAATEKTTAQQVVQNNSVSADTALPQSSVAIQHDDEEVAHRMIEGLYATSMNPLPEAHAPWPWMKEKIVSPTPRNSTSRKWQTGWWAALGSTRLSQTASLFGTAKAAADFSSSNPGNVRYVSSSTEKNGQYFSAGWMLRKPMGKRWAFSTGLGLGFQSWQVSTSVFADSILPSGSLYNRALTSTNDQRFRMYSLQIPMLLEWRVLGKQEGIWLQGGLNNQWLLQLQEKQSLATLPQNFASISNTNNVTSKAYGWQPQLRLGLVYQWQSKKFIHQMVPAVQLPLRSAFKTDNRGLLNIQLQYNMLWLRK